ncbi:MAG: hypothetical protein WC508_05615 [Patescibacteria group bacterium]
MLKRRKREITLGGVFVFGLIIIFSFYFWHQQQTKDSLINFAPIDSVLYVSARDSVWPESQQSISDLPLRNFYQQIAEKEIFSGVDLQKDLVANSQQVSLIMLPGKNSNFDLVFIFKIKNYLALEPAMAKLKYSLLIKKNILVAATSQQGIDRIKEVENGKTFPLTLKVQINKFGNSRLTLFLSADNLKLSFGASAGLVDKIFTHLLSQDIYISSSYRKQNQQWQFKLNNSDSILSEQIYPPRVKFLPPDFSIYLSGVNLFEMFKGWQGMDNEFSNFLKQTADSLRTVYSFSPNQLLVLAKQPADLIIFKKEQASALGFDYVLVFDKRSAEQIGDLIKLVKIILAEKMPKEVSHTLPDETKVTELLADTEVWQLKQETVDNNLVINYLQEPALNFELAYAVKDNQLMIASSVQRLKDVMSASNLSITGLESKCRHSGLLNRYLILNNQRSLFTFDPYLPDGGIMAIEGSSGVNGCFVDF